MFGTENGECRMRPITYYHNNQLWVGEPSHIFDSGTHFEEWKCICIREACQKNNALKTLEIIL